MFDPNSLAAAILLLVNTASVWLPPIRNVFLSKGAEKGAELAIDRGLQIGRKWLYLDEREQLKHLKRVLRNAAERSAAKFEAQKDRDQLRDILTVLSEPGHYSEALRTEAMDTFTLSDSPNFATLSELYNHALRFRTLNQATAPKDIDATPYIRSFFEALQDEMYSDTLFHELISDALKVRGILNMERSLRDMERSLTEVVITLHQIGGTLSTDYTAEQFEQDLAVYVAHLERTLRYLKLVGVVPKDRSNENIDPELDAIFVPLRVALQDRTKFINEAPDSIVPLLEQYPCIVLLGDPGSGKSTITRHLAWSHAMANLPNSSITPSNTSLLSGRHLPLRIELRRLAEDRKQLPDCDFLDYAKEILLGRAGIHIHRQMFEELLERRPMLFLFDGLDEVATLDDRRRLVEEIENFAQSYPGNCILVTSRSVGYELAPLSNRWFAHARVQEFNDQQIRLFLERWYTHVLRLSPLPPDDQQELETLYTTLTTNTRLYRLAANPLLLTVITALHRYERLPDRRILVYDRCADLLLDTWAKLRGTDVRWKDMKMGKEDQYACVAHLGFVLHERSQESKEGILEPTSFQLTSSVEDFANDVPTKFLLREIDRFLRSRKLFSEVAEQRAEAERFLALMRIETGLIVERGKDESGEDLYGFVHRTFQEYFAAADVYERYLQEDDSTIISDFLADHLHDPHWHEVVLLLLGKLKRKQATVQLRRILKAKSRLSRYAEVVKQDLFFACTCLTEEINVENDFAEQLISLMSSLVKNSPFPSQQIEALEVLASLLPTRQYSGLARKELKALTAQDNLLDTSVKIQVATFFYQSDSRELESEERQRATRVFGELLQRPDLSAEQAVKVAEALFWSSLSGSKERQRMTQVLDELLQRPDLSVEQTAQVAGALYWYSSYQSEEQQRMIQVLDELLQRPDLRAEQTAQVARVLYWGSLNDLGKLHRDAQMLGELLQRPDLSVEQTVQVALALFWSYISGSGEQQRVTRVLDELLQRPDLSIEQTAQVARALFWSSLSGSKERQRATRVLDELLQRPDLSVEQTAQVARALYSGSPYQSEEQQRMTRVLDELLQRPDLSIEQTAQVAETLYRSSLSGSKERQRMTQVLDELLQRPDLSIEQTARVAEVLYWGNPYQSEDQRQAVQILTELLQRPDLSAEQTVQIAQALYDSDRYQLGGERATQVLVELLQRPDLSVEQTVQVAQALYEPYYVIRQRQAAQVFDELLQRPDLSVEQTVQVARALYDSDRYQLGEQQRATEMLVELLQRPDLSVEQTVQVAQALSGSDPYQLGERKRATEVLVQLLRRPDLSVEQTVQVAQALYESSPYQPEERQSATEVLVELLRRPDLSVEQTVQVARALSGSDPYQAGERRRATEVLVELLRRPDLSVEQTVQVARALYESNPYGLAEWQRPTEVLYESNPYGLAEWQRPTEVLVELLQRPGLSVEQTVQVARALYEISPYQPGERQCAIQALLRLAQEQNISINQRLEAATVPLTLPIPSYPDRVKAAQLVLNIDQGELAKQYLGEHWSPPSVTGHTYEIDVSDVSLIAEIAMNERMPTQVRDEMYQLLRNIIPKFEVHS